MKILRFILSIILLGYISTLFGYAFFNKDLHVLTMQNGLSGNTISCIYKDKDRFMWFGTDNGISRYDGKAIKNFINDSSYMSVSELTEITEECLGIVSNNQIQVFNRRTESFIPIKQGGGNAELRASHILSVGDGKFWGILANELTLYKVRKEKDSEGRVISLSLSVDRKLGQLIDRNTSFAAFCYTVDGAGLYLVTRDSQLHFFDGREMKIKKSVSLNLGKDQAIASVVEADGFVWVSTLARGLVRYNLASGQINHINYGEQDGQSRLSHTDVFKIVPIHNQRYIAVTWNGYTLLTSNKEHPDELVAEIYNNAAFVNRNLETRMISAYFDPDGILWIGTNGGGVMFTDLRLQNYNQYHQERHNEICGIVADKKQTIWLATFHGGIMKSDTPFDPTRNLNFSAVGTPEIRAKSTVLSVMKDKKGDLWFGNKDGTLTFYDDTSGQFKVCPLLRADGTINRSPVWSMYIDSKNRFWIGTEESLLLFDTGKNLCRKIPVNEKLRSETRILIRAITETRDGTLWLGTVYHGVCKMLINKKGEISVTTGYEKKAGHVQHSVRSLLSSKDGLLYIGYTDGFAVLSPEQDAIKHCYTTHEGLSSSFIGCIIEDRKGHIWLGTNSGMSRYSRHQHLFYNYYIAGSNRSAFLFDNTLFWGNNKSLTFFEPDKIDAYQSDNKVIFTALEISGNRVEIDVLINEQNILKRGISFTDSITLSYDNRDFSLMFNNLSYSEDQQKYNYRLLPYQENWQVSNGGEKASFTNLPEGEYSFEVRSIYPDGKVGELTTLHIKILPHWSNSSLFRLLILFALLGGIAYLIRLYRIRRQRMEHEMQMKQELLALNLEREKEKQIRTERENFFTGAAHELRTPLTLILSPLQEILQQTNPAETIYKKLWNIHKNGTALHTLVDRFLYVQKIEAGMVRLQLSEVDIVQLVRDVADSFRQMAETKKFLLEIDLPDTPVILYVDVEKMSSAVRNLLSNAFKYTSSEGNVVVSLTRTVTDDKGFCLVRISDTGVGIPEEFQERVFDSFITGSNAPNISSKVGLGLRIVKNTLNMHHGKVTLESASGQGSCFTLHIPEGKVHFVDDDFQEVCYDKIQDRKIDDEQLERPTNVEESEKPETKKKLLIIEDNQLVREYVCSLFASKYILLEAKNGEEGVSVALEQMPDMIVSDVMMPLKDGFTCCREIRMNAGTAHIPILMLTAKAEDADMLESTNCGADDYMMKPFNPELLQAKVENLIRQRERLKRIYTKALMVKNKSIAGEKQNPFIQQLVNVIEVNLSDEGFNVKLLAEQLNMSQPTLYRKMKQHTDLAVIDMIRSVRVSKAASLIMENQYSIQQISEMVGFSDVRTLRKHFTEQFGVSPSKYINQTSDIE